MARTPGPFVLQLELDSGSGKQSHRLSAALVRAIADRQLVDGQTVPSTRILAQNLRIARSVVVEAYEELMAAGFFVSRPGSGTRRTRVRDGLAGRGVLLFGCPANDRCVAG